MKKTAILGFGNPVRSDDAVGCYIIEKLQKHGDPPGHTSLFDMGTGAFEVLYKLMGHERIIIADGVINTGEAPGTLYRLPAHEIEAAISDDPMVFLHSLKWDQALSYAKKIMQDKYPDDITVFLVAIDDTRLEVNLSAPVKEAGDRVAELIMELLREETLKPSPPKA